MTVVEAVRSRLATVSALTALVSTRIYSLKLPQTPTLPAVRLQQVSEVEPMQLRGSSGLARARVQVDAYAQEGSGTDPYAQAHQVSAAAHGTFAGGAASGLNGWRGTVGSPGFEILEIESAGLQEGFNPEELRQVIVSRDYFVTFRTS